ncbi:hypothetical protein B0A67_03505 [Flavobacterium aquidurense]|nr:hypothetical protein B0A67_03505 [Flavobacterium aquidurense]
MGLGLDKALFSDLLIIPKYKTNFPLCQLHKSVVNWSSFHFVLFVALANTYSFAILVLFVGWCELQMCMASCDAYFK